eukprot:5840598-Pyramimonas_sp.AAC.1
MSGCCSMVEPREPSVWGAAWLFAWDVFAHAVLWIPRLALPPCRYTCLSRVNGKARALPDKSQTVPYARTYLLLLESKDAHESYNEQNRIRPKSAGVGSFPHDTVLKSVPSLGFHFAPDRGVNPMPSSRALMTLALHGM